MKTIHFLNEEETEIVRSGRWLALQNMPESQLRSKRGRIEPERPFYNKDTQYLGNISVNDKELFWPVIDYTAEQLRSMIPSVVTMRQARIYLSRMDLLQSVEVQVQAMGEEAVLSWEYAQEVDRGNMFVKGLNFTDEQLDVMFLEASKIQ
jgi:hypothetical protein